MKNALGDVVVFCKNRPHVQTAIEYLKPHAENLTVFEGVAGEAFPEEAKSLTPDLLISYISSWIIPAELIGNTKNWAVNFHPGPPEYPGTGCTNFALYNEVTEYGVTAHLMEATVDTGSIFAVKRFDVSSSDSVQSVTNRSYDALIEVFKITIDSLVSNGVLPESDEVWKAKPTTRKQLDALCKIEPSMSEVEIRKRVRATYFPGKPGAYIELAGHKFCHKEEEK